MNKLLRLLIWILKKIKRLFKKKKMNKFFEFSKYLDRFNNRNYFNGTWEKLKMEAFRLLPFQYQRQEGVVFEIYQDTTDISDLFYDVTNKITSWTGTTGGNPFSSTGSLITGWVVSVGNYCTSNNITLTEGDKLYYKINTNTWGGTRLKVEIKFGASVVKTYTQTSANDIGLFYTVENSGTHTVVLTISTAGTNLTNVYNTLAETVLEQYEGANTYLSYNTVENSGTHTVVLPISTATVLEQYEGANTYLSYNGDNLYGMVTNGECYFKIDTGTEELYSEDCDVGCVNGLVNKFRGDATDSNRSFTFEDGDEMNSNRFKVNKGDVITLYIHCDYTSDIIATLNMTGISDVIMVGDQNGGSDLWKFTGTAIASGEAYVFLQNDSVVNLTIQNYDIERGYSDKCITLEVSSTVDYGGIHYADGFTQKWYKSAQVRRSINPQITVIGDERNGVIIKEKYITSTKYTSTFKVTEPEMNALITAAAGTVTITDMEGNTYTCNNIEISDPTWVNGNGTTQFSFIDNNNVHTLNNSLL